MWSSGPALSSAPSKLSVTQNQVAVQSSCASVKAPKMVCVSRTPGTDHNTGTGHKLYGAAVLWPPTLLSDDFPKNGGGGHRAVIAGASGEGSLHV